MNTAPVEPVSSWSMALRVCVVGVAIQALAVLWVAWLGGLSLHAKILCFVVLLALDLVGLLAVVWSSRRSAAVLFTAAFATLAVGYPSWAEQRRRSENSRIATYQLWAAVNQYFMENRDRVFVAYDDVVGPTRYIKSVAKATPVDYAAMFPLRVDWEAMPVTMSDGRQVIVTSEGTVWVSPRGEITGWPDAVKYYRAVLDAQRGRNGREISRGPLGGRFETTWRNGVREGPFQAYYETGQLWAEANYVGGRPVGRHVVFDRTGKVIQETNFSASVGRAPSR